MQQAMTERMYVMLSPKVGTAGGHARLSPKGLRTAISISLSAMPRISLPYRALLLSKPPVSAVIDLGTLTLSPSGQGRLVLEGLMLPMGTGLVDFHALIICSDWPDTRIYAAGALFGGTLIPLWQMEETVRAYLRVPSKDEKPQPIAVASPEPRDMPAHDEQTPAEPYFHPASEPADIADIADIAEMAEMAENPPPSTHGIRPHTEDMIPVDALPPLYWPQAIRDLKVYFDTLLPFAPFDMPGWRFVKVPLENRNPAPYCAVGVQIESHRIARVLYALPGRQGTLPPPGLRGYRFKMGRNGQGYWTLIQNAAPTAQASEKLY